MKKLKGRLSDYDFLLSEMKAELQNLINTKIADDDVQNIGKVQAKWNAIVNCTTKWIQIADNGLGDSYLKDKFQREAKRSLITYGTILLSEVNGMKCTNTKAKYKKRQFLEELNDRLQYIRAK